MSLPVERFAESSYERIVRWIALAALSFGLASVAGCFHPDVKNGGFACSMTDSEPCPNGFFCVNGLCEDHPGVSSSPDFSTGGTGGGGGGGSAGGGGGGGGLSTDMAHASFDLSTPAGDMAGGNCAADGDDCTSQPCCGSDLCFPFVNICIPSS